MAARCTATNDASARCRRVDGHEGEHSAGPPGTPLRNFRCDGERWLAFLTTCRKNKTDASAQIRDMIDLWLDANGVAPPDSFLWPVTTPPQD